MIDFTESLAANPPTPSWTRDVALAVAKDLVEGTPLTVDWDRAAGEEWISLLGGEARVGIVSASRPLAVLAAGEEQVVERVAGHPVGVVLVPSFADPVLFGDEEELRAAFGTPVDVSPFTADDLWFCTI